MIRPQSLIDEASDFILSFSEDDLQARLELSDGIFRMANVSATLCGADSFLALAESGNIMGIAEFCRLTKVEYESALVDFDGPDPGWFAVLHLMGLNLVNGLAESKLAQATADFGAR